MAERARYLKYVWCHSVMASSAEGTAPLSRRALAASFGADRLADHDPCLSRSVLARWALKELKARVAAK